MVEFSFYLFLLLCRSFQMWCSFCFMVFCAFWPLARLIREKFLQCFLLGFYGFSLCLSFWWSINLIFVSMRLDPVLLFLLCFFSFPSTICWRDCLFPFGVLGTLLQIVVNSICWDLILSYLFCLGASLRGGSTILFLLSWLYNMVWNLMHNISKFVLFS